jgi:hypothetical protein
MTDAARPATGAYQASGGWDGDHVGDVRGDGRISGDGRTVTEPHPLADIPPLTDDEPGIDPTELTDGDLLRELASLHRTRLDTLRHGPDHALATHLRRTAELETEYLTRNPGREIDPTRLTQGA